MIVRPATHADLPGILEIYNDAVLHTTATADYEPTTLAARTAWFEDHVRADYPVFVAADATERVTGWSSLSAYHSRIGYRFTAEDSVYVAADRRGQGVGKQLLSPIIAAARERNLHAVIASIDGSNEASIRLHAAFGFAHAGHLKQVIQKFGRWLDVVYMELLLEEEEV